MMEKDVLELIAEILAVSPEKLSPETAIGDIPQWNSMAQMSIIGALEEQLGIEFPIEDLFELTNIDAIVKEVEKVKNG